MSLNHRAVVASAGLVAALFTTVASADQINITSWVSRVGTASGLADEYTRAYVQSESRYGTDTLSSVTRPNDSSTWDGSTQTTRSLAYSGPFDGASVGSWMSSNFSGDWDVSWNAGGTESFNTAPYYQSVTGRTYLELTSGSANDFQSILDNGSTGTFTFNLTQEWYTEGQVRAYISTEGDMAGDPASQTVDLTYIDGSSFSLDIDTALASDARLVLQYQSGAFLQTFGSGYSAYMTTFAETVYGTAGSTPAVPGPAAAAVLAGLGAARRRRR